MNRKSHLRHTGCSASVGSGGSTGLDAYAGDQSILDGPETRPSFLLFDVMSNIFLILYQVPGTVPSMPPEEVRLREMKIPSQFTWPTRSGARAQTLVCPTALFVPFC